MKEKQGLEIGAIENFISAYTKNTEETFEFIQLLEPPLPDGICTLNDKNIYIEVGHIYGTTPDVKHLLGRKGNSAPTDKDMKHSRLITLNTRLIKPLNYLLEKKSNKKYNGSPVWLLIRNAMPLWSKNDFQNHLNEITVPTKHPFEKIWLLCGPNSSFGILQIY